MAATTPTRATEETDNSAHEGIVGGEAQPTEAYFPVSHQAGPPPGVEAESQGSYEELQWELADLRREMATLRRTPATTLTVPL